MSRSRLARAVRAEDGMTIIEVMVAAAVLVGGLLSTFLVLDGARDLNTVSERKEVAVHRAERQLERVQVIAFDNLQLAAAPACPTSPCPADDPRVQISGTNYDWDATSSSNAAEPLVIKPAATTNPDAITSHEDWTEGPFAGTLDTFVTTTATDLKRVTVVVRITAGQGPRRPIYLSTFVSRQGA